MADDGIASCGPLVYDSAVLGILAIGTRPVELATVWEKAKRFDNNSAFGPSPCHFIYSDRDNVIAPGAFESALASTDCLVVMVDLDDPRSFDEVNSVIPTNANAVASPKTPRVGLFISGRPGESWLASARRPAWMAQLGAWAPTLISDAADFIECLWAPVTRPGLIGFDYADETQMLNAGLRWGFSMVESAIQNPRQLVSSVVGQLRERGVDVGSAHSILFVVDGTPVPSLHVCNTIALELFDAIPAEANGMFQLLCDGPVGVRLRLKVMVGVLP